VNVVDANVLLYAVNADADRHDESRDWLDHALAGNATIGFSWISTLAFVRLVTKPGLFPQPLTVAEAIEQVREWTAQPGAATLEPTARHLDVLGDLLRAAGGGGNLVNDAHLAALAIEHRGAVVSYDADFDRFPGVTWRRPA
jgi:toxin-antitoxin system PIN domain toxin